MTLPNQPRVTVYGIRHHGPGSARSLLQAFEREQPDILLLEGPPDAADVLPLALDPAMRPPVALLVYPPEQPREAVFYPFAEYSPEWQALCYALRNRIPARMIDLPQANRMALLMAQAAPPAMEGGEPGVEVEQDNPPTPTIAADPLGWLAVSAGYADGESWWERMVEQRRDSHDLFAGILEAMTALRREAEASGESGGEFEALREANMRQGIRAALKEGFTRIAVVCGAWHAPALASLPPAAQDAALLRGLPRVKVAATWAPWSNDRLTFESGYGAGVRSPGWFEHLWRHPDGASVRWLARVAQLLRGEEMSASSANVIEAVRLADALAALRDFPAPGLAELNEAARAVFFTDSDLPMQMIARKLIVGETLGAVPDGAPKVPLQQDLERQARHLRLAFEAADRSLNLDLRSDTDRQRSILLHRLALLDIDWGRLEQAGGKGTFHELWTLRWQPEFAVMLIEAAVYGNTVVDAAAARAIQRGERAGTLGELTGLVARALLAELPEALAALMARLQAVSTVSADVGELMDALPALVNVLRYGSVRQNDRKPVAAVVDGLVARICVGLPPACAALDDEAAARMFDRMVNTDAAFSLLQDESAIQGWQRALQALAGDPHGARTSAAPLVAGRAGRILHARGEDGQQSALRMSQALSPGNEAWSAAWLEGFLRGSGLLLLHDDPLWALLDDWLTGLPAGSFTNLLPLLRRTFGTFSPAERRQIGEKARHGAARATRAGADGAEFDPLQAARVLPLVAALLGLDHPQEGGTP